MAKAHCLGSKKTSSPQSAQTELAGYCKALAHPIRVEILKTLIAEGQCISGELAEKFDKAHSTISEHLKILKSAGLVLGTIEGPKRCYCVNPKALKKMNQLINLLIFDPECCRSIEGISTDLKKENLWVSSKDF